MEFTPVLRSEGLKLLTLRSLRGNLLALFAVTVVFSALAASSDTSAPDFDPLFTALSGVLPGQMAAMAFGTVAVSSEYHGNSIRTSLAAVPRRGRWLAAKLLVVAAPVLAVGLLAALAALLVARSVLGPAASTVTVEEQIRGVVGCGVYFTLMALLAAGLTVLFRSGVATLSVLIPFILIVSFVVGDVVGGVVGYLPDRAGQVVIHQTSVGAPGPWTGLAVTALWAAAALAAGAWRLRRRDA
ncbi:ABC transporter permease subunit [Streptomyces sp. SHP 1-2]|uniref:ABC transporter permease subunit n=1 Tax=Streptomyces sp. SHP 1-2 TaxID=2769489 RepID=UPI002238FE77|nr:ABC transporter permease subunit [Streptomyces sp. SHP 1-2]MCW5253665.1 ABC transporter permease subunit [Streptomyces sp. SHP 1-2]